jgi:Dolichyl-phosphate-mannose-protein mannosyltransferase
MLVVLLLAFAVQFYRLDARTFHGDELSSLTEARNLGQNPNGILYFAVLHFWIAWGMNEFWLRAPSALLAVASAAAGYRLVEVLTNRAGAILAGCLLATSPFLIEFAQQVRFYSLFLFTATCAYLGFVFYLQKPSFKRLGVLGIADVFVVGSHFFGLLVIVSQALAALIVTQRLRLRLKLVLVGGTALLAALMAASIPLRQIVYGWMSRLTNPYGDPSYAGARGLSLANLAKIPLTFFFFGIGESVYPLALSFVLPALLVLAFVGAIGVTAMARRRRIGLALIAGLGLFPVVVYLILDPLSKPGLEGAAPRYLIFLLPLFYLVLAAGTRGKHSTFLIVPLLLINAGGLVSYWYGDWAYTDDLINWRSVTAWVGNYVTPQSLVLLDGRSQQTAIYYFPPSWHTENDWGYESAGDITPLQKFPRLILLSDDFNPDPRTLTGALIQEIEKSYSRTAAWSQYPLFVYVFDRQPSDVGTYHVDPATGNVTIPVQIYGLEFQDLRLPIPASAAGRPLQLGGAFALPGPRQELAQTIPLDQSFQAGRVVLLSNVTGASQLLTGTQIATLKVTKDDGSSRIFPIRIGYETSAWNVPCAVGGCQPVYTWRKRLALLGAASYPGSWSEFDASIFAGQFALEPPSRVRSLELDRIASTGTLNVWGIVLTP